MSCSTTITVLPVSRSAARVPSRARVVALVQPYRGLIQDVHDAGESRSHLTREPDALGLTARERLGAAIEGEIVETYILEEAQPIAHILENARRDFRAPTGQLELAQRLQRIAHRQVRELRQGVLTDEHETRGAIEAGAAAVRTGVSAQILRELFAHARRDWVSR